MPFSLDPRTFAINVDQKMPFASRLTSGSDWVNPDITEDRFPFVPVKDRGRVTLRIAQAFELRTREVTVLQSRRQLRSATWDELLAFGAAFPDQEDLLMLVAQGSGWDDAPGIVGTTCCVTYLHWIDGRRSFSLAHDAPERVWYNERLLLAHL